MEPLSIYTIRKRIEEANKRYSLHRFELLYNSCRPTEVFIVDLAFPASQNAISREMIGLLVGDISSYFVEIYNIGFVAADEFSVQTGYYLAISCYL